MKINQNFLKSALFLSLFFTLTQARAQRFEVSEYLDFTSYDTAAYGTPLIDSPNDLMFLAMETNPARIVKAQLSTRNTLQEQTFASVDKFYTALKDNTGTFGYFSTESPTPKILKIRLADLVIVDTLELELGETGIRDGRLDPANNIVYYPSAAGIVKVSVAPGNFSRVGRLDMTNLEPGIALDPINNFGYVVRLTDVVRFDLVGFTEVATAPLDPGETKRGLLYYSTSTKMLYAMPRGNPANPIIGKVEASTSSFQRVGGHSLNAYNYVGAFRIGDELWLAQGDRGWFAKINLISGVGQSALLLNNGFDTFHSVGFDEVTRTFVISGENDDIIGATSFNFNTQSTNGIFDLGINTKGFISNFPVINDHIIMAPTTEFVPSLNDLRKNFRVHRSNGNIDALSQANQSDVYQIMVDQAEEFAYFYSGTSSRFINKVRLSDNQSMERWTIPLTPESTTLDASNGFLYTFNTGDDVLKVDTSNMSLTSTLDLTGELNEGNDMAADGTNGYLYVGGRKAGTNTAIIAKINLNDFSTRSYLELSTGSARVKKIYFDDQKNLLYAYTQSLGSGVPFQFFEIDGADFSIKRSINLTGIYTGLSGMTLDRIGNCFYIGAYGGRIAKFDLSTFSFVSVLTLETKVGVGLNSSSKEPVDGFIYFAGATGNLGYVAKIDVRDLPPTTIGSKLIGPREFPISDPAPAGLNDDDFYSEIPALAYNRNQNEYLVAWTGSDDIGSMTQLDKEVIGRLVNAGTGEPVGPNFRISDVGPDNSSAYQASDARVVYNSVDNEYLVLWTADDDKDGSVEDEFEIYGQRISAFGEEIGENDFRITQIGTDGDTNSGVNKSDVVYNPNNNEYLVVWSGIEGPEREVYAQRLNKFGAKIGPSKKISDIGPIGDASFYAGDISVTHNTTNNEYLVVWQAVDDGPGVVAGEKQIYGQRLSAEGVEIGANDFKISDLGERDTQEPSVAYNSNDNEYLVIFRGQDVYPRGQEVFGQLLNHEGIEIGVNDFQISRLGLDNSPGQDPAKGPQVIYLPHLNQYAVAFYGENNANPNFGNSNGEIFLQHISASGEKVGIDNELVSNFGSDGLGLYEAYTPRMAYNSYSKNMLIAWTRYDRIGDSEVFKLQIFGQFYGEPLSTPPALRTPANQRSVNSVFVYPNPFRPALGHTQMNFTNIPVNTMIRILDLKGALVKELTADSSGVATWDARNISGENVSSGVYFAYLEGAGADKTIKIAIQR